MEPRSRETTPTKEDLEFIVDDGYRHDEDPDYVPTTPSSKNEKFIPETDLRSPLLSIVNNYFPKRR